MTPRQLVADWFGKWQSGDVSNLPITGDFTHTSPFGCIEGKRAYLDLVEANKDKFLGHKFELEDALYGEDKACVCYIAIQGDFRLAVSEWYYFAGGLIQSIVAYYHIGDIRQDRQLNQPERDRPQDE